VKESEERLNVTRKALADAQTLRVQVLIPSSIGTELVVFFLEHICMEYETCNDYKHLKVVLFYYQEKARVDELEQISRQKISDLEKEVCSEF